MLMPLPTPSGLRSILSVLTVATAYSLSLWRIIKGNRGNRVIECGSIALMIALLMVVLIKSKICPIGCNRLSDCCCSCYAC
jgi:hypothetical protein